MKRVVQFIFLVIILKTSFMLTACNVNMTSLTKSSSKPLSPSHYDYAKLSDTGLYDDILNKEISVTNKAFQPNFELWTDGAQKLRWFYLPDATQINTSNMELWEFPVGTKFWKEFSFLGKRVETRLSEKVAPEPKLSSWKFYSFAWNAEESDAEVVDRLGIENAAFTGLMPDGESADPLSAGTSHDIPSQGSCSRCHNKGGDPVLGFSAMQLSDVLKHVEGNERNDEMIGLTELLGAGKLTNAPAELPAIPSTDLSTQQVLGFLHANCSMCHNPKSSAGRVTGMHLNLLTTARNLVDEPIMQTALGQLTRNYEVPERTMGVDSYRIEPGQPDKSAIFLRLKARGSFEQMPPLGTEVVHRRDVNLVRDWIISLPADSFMPPDRGFRR